MGIMIYANGLSPCGESGLKSSFPVAARAADRLSPCGESGLKFRICLAIFGLIPSLPVWGEWIEMQSITWTARRKSVSPRVGRVD